MKVEGHSGRWRPTVCFLFLALFLGFFVAAMSAPAVYEGHAFEQVLFSFPHPFSYTTAVDQNAHTISLTFAHVSPVELQSKYVSLGVVTPESLVQKVAIRSDEQSKGTCVTLTLAPLDAIRVNLRRFSQTNQLMLGVYRVDADWAEQRCARLLLTSATLYKA